MRNCPVCQHNKSNILLNLEYALFDDLELSGYVKLVQCHLCGMIYNHSVLTERDLLHYYQKNAHYLETMSPGAGGYSKPEQDRYQYIAEQIEPHLTLGNPFVLDFGCGKGGMLQWFVKQRQWRVCGVEASRASRNFIENNFEFPVYSSISEVQEKVDIIILSHVLEHLFSPEKILADLEHLCHAETIVYIEVPMADDYLRNPINWPQLYFEHINHFEFESLHRLLSSLYFKVLYHTNIHFFPNEPTSPLSLVFLARKTLDHKQPAFKEHETILSPAKPCQELINKINPHSKSISIWGVSQYAQLLLGTYPDLTKKIKYLFDSSSAKIGRTIRGIEVESPENLSRLGKEDLLLLPKGQYTNEMLQQLNQINFKGEVIQY